jgi:hypothetical protein
MNFQLQQTMWELKAGQSVIKFCSERESAAGAGGEFARIASQQGARPQRNAIFDKQKRVCAKKPQLPAAR